MKVTRRTAGVCLVSAGAVLLATPFVARLFGQDQAPNRPEFTIVAKDFRFSPDRIAVTQDDLVKITIRSEDVAHSFAIDEYRIVKRVPAGGSTTVEFRADKAGTFEFYCNLTDQPGHAQMRGELVVRPEVAQIRGIPRARLHVRVNGRDYPDAGCPRLNRGTPTPTSDRANWA